MRFFIKVAPVEVLPRGYGLVRREAFADWFLCAPIPFNLVLRAAWHVWCSMRVGVWRIKVEDDLKRAYRAGERDGFDRGLKAGAKAATDNMAKYAAEYFVKKRV